MNIKKSIMWLGIEKIENHFFVHSLFKFNNKEKKIRFAIDGKTADGFEKILTQKPFNEKYGSDYSYLNSGYSIDKSENKYEHYVEIKLGKMRKKVKVQCSESFCRNLKWLFEVESISGIENIVMK